MTFRLPLQNVSNFASVILIFLLSFYLASQGFFDLTAVENLDKFCMILVVCICIACLFPVVAPLVEELPDSPSAVRTIGKLVDFSTPFLLVLYLAILISLTGFLHSPFTTVLATFPLLSVCLIFPRNRFYSMVKSALYLSVSLLMAYAVLFLLALNGDSSISDYLDQSQESTAGVVSAAAPYVIGYSLILAIFGFVTKDSPRDQRGGGVDK